MNTIASEKKIENTIKFEALKGKILVKIAETNDEDLLNEILDFINATKSRAENPSINLSRHIPEIFERYNETMQKLAK